MYCVTCPKCVYISTNKTTNCYDCKKCKACCNVLNIAFKDQKPTIFLFGGDGTHCFARKTSRDYGKRSPFLKSFLHQSQPTTTEREVKKVKRSPIMEKTYPFAIGWWFEQHIHFFESFCSISTYCQPTKIWMNWIKTRYFVCKNFFKICFLKFFFLENRAFKKKILYAL